MSNRSVEKIVHAHAVNDGAGVTVHRTIGTPELPNLDPFLLLDHFGSDDPNEYIAGFPDHPHRGFVTFTYMLDGHMLHRDSMGNEGDLKSGGAQWMKAASGVIHSEMPQQSAGLMRGFQLWINLPAGDKMSAPAYQEFSPAAIPEHGGDGCVVKVLIGRYGGVSGPVEDPHTEVQYLDVRLDGERTFSHGQAGDRRVFVYVYDGEATVEHAVLPRHTLAVLGGGDTVRIGAGGNGARFILVSGRPLGEPIAQYGPFVMNSQAEIRQAMMDYQAGRLVQRKAAVRAA